MNVLIGCETSAAVREQFSMKELILKILNSDLSNEAKAEEIQRQIDIHDSEKIKNTSRSNKLEEY